MTESSPHSPIQSNKELPFDNSPWILPVFKPKGPSSYDIIRDLKRPLFKLLGKGRGRRKLKIGHFGTLDPFAEGILLVGTGKALKLMEYFQKEMTKKYRGIGTLAYSTDTGDEQGELLKKSDSENWPTMAAVQNACLAFLGEYPQRPPYFSAVKHEGKPLYEWARQGVFVDKPAVLRYLHFFDVSAIHSEEKFEYEFHCEVSSGTYIRGLWCDLARVLGKEGHLTQLTREGWGEFQAKDAKKLPIDSLSYDDLKRPDEFWDISKVFLKAEDARRFCQGQFLERPNFEGKLCWVYDDQELLLGLGGPAYNATKVGRNGLLKVVVSLTD